MAVLEDALAHSRNAGIDECELVRAARTVTTIRITNSAVAEVKQGVDDRYGIRLIHRNRIASVQAAGDDLRGSIDFALGLSRHVRPVEFWTGLPHAVRAARLDRTFDKRLRDIPARGAADIAQEMINSAADGRVDAVTGSLNIVSEYFEIENSHGLRHADDATYISGMINADSERGIVPVSGMGHCSARTLSGFSPARVGEDAREMCVGSINPQKVEPGRYSVIFEPYSVGELLSFVVAPNFNLKTFAEGRSCFSGRMGERIAAEGLDMADDPLVPGGIGTRPVDDEGVETQRRLLVENGVMGGTFSNIFDACREGAKSSGNATRQGEPMGRGTDPVPDSAAHNLTMGPGGMSPEEMIKDTRLGLLVGRLWYTYPVNPIRGDFSCTARSGIRIIKNGFVVPAEPVRIIHNLHALLGGISGIGSDSRGVIQWASRPATAPSVRVDGVPAEAL